MILILPALTRWTPSDANDNLFFFQLNFDTDQEDESEESGLRKLSGTLRAKKVTQFFRQKAFFFAKILGKHRLTIFCSGKEQSTSKECSNSVKQQHRRPRVFICRQFSSK